jgi:hypothetical protein
MPIKNPTLQVSSFTHSFIHSTKTKTLSFLPQYSTPDDFFTAKPLSVANDPGQKLIKELIKS